VIITCILNVFKVTCNQTVYSCLFHPHHHSRLLQTRDNISDG